MSECRWLHVDKWLQETLKYYSAIEAAIIPAARLKRWWDFQSITGDGDGAWRLWSCPFSFSPLAFANTLTCKRQGTSQKIQEGLYCSAVTNTKHKSLVGQLGAVMMRCTFLFFFLNTIIKLLCYLAAKNTQVAYHIMGSVKQKGKWSSFLGLFDCCDMDAWGLQSTGTRNILITSDTAALLSPNAFSKCPKPRFMLALPFIFACARPYQCICVARRTEKASNIWLYYNPSGLLS